MLLAVVRCQGDCTLAGGHGLAASSCEAWWCSSSCGACRWWQRCTGRAQPQSVRSQGHSTVAGAMFSAVAAAVAMDVTGGAFGAVAAAVGVAVAVGVIGAAAGAMPNAESVTDGAGGAPLTTSRGNKGREVAGARWCRDAGGNEVRDGVDDRCCIAGRSWHGRRSSGQGDGAGQAALWQSPQTQYLTPGVGRAVRFVAGRAAPGPGVAGTMAFLCMVQLVHEAVGSVRYEDRG